MAAAALRRHTPRLISDYGSAHRIAVECQQPLPVQADGDFKGYFKKLELNVETAGAQILAPQVRRAALEKPPLPRAAELRAPVATG